jgi:hypothetical protein
VGTALRPERRSGRKALSPAEMALGPGKKLEFRSLFPPTPALSRMEFRNSSRLG